MTQLLSGSRGVAYQAQYDLLARRRDRACRLVNRATGKIVPVRAMRRFPCGLLIAIRGAVSVLLFRDEICYVDEFPE